MQRFILTGAPGSGKTSILSHLRQKGHTVIAEAATDVIAAEQARGTPEPWLDPTFIDKIITLQRARQLTAAAPVPPTHAPPPPSARPPAPVPPPARLPAPVPPPARLPALRAASAPSALEVGSVVQFFDRSPVCTLALARYLGHPESPALARELTRIADLRVYQPQVFFVRLLGFIEPTAARRISYAESLEFERVHEAEYRRLGYHLIDIPPMSIALRASLVTRHATHSRPDLRPRVHPESEPVQSRRRSSTSHALPDREYP